MEELEWQKHAYKTGDQYVTRCGKIAIFMTNNPRKQELTWVMNSDESNGDVVVFKTDFDCHEINGDTRLDIVGEHYIVPIDEYLNRRVKI